MKKVVVIGGGTGTATVLSSLVGDEELSLTGIVSIADSGGSTGRLRDEFGFIPVGDVRQCLGALAVGENSNLVRELLLYRFPQQSSLVGHNLGNLILTALTDLYQTPGKAIEVASKILRLKGQVFPISQTPADLVIEYSDGSMVVGEDYLNYHQHGGKQIKRISLKQKPAIYQRAKQAILAADLIIFGPGDLYASLLPNTLVRGFKPTLCRSVATYVYIANLMTNYAQTHLMTARDHLQEVITYSGRVPDWVVINQQPIKNQRLVASYQQQGSSPLVDDLSFLPFKIKVCRANLLAATLAAQNKNDQLERNYLRHHAKNLHRVIKNILNEKKQNH